MNGNALTVGLTLNALVLQLDQFTTLPLRKATILKRLSKAVQAERDAIYVELQSTYSNLEDAVTKYNEAVKAAREALELAINDHNEQVDAANGWANASAAAEIRDYMGERSEKWQESDRGQAYEEWASSYEQWTLDRIEIEIPEALDESVVDMPENPFEDLQEEIEF